MVSVASFLAGVVAAVRLARWVSRRRRTYIGFALRAPVGRLLALEVAGVVVYAVVAWLGVTRSPWYLAVGWMGHILWDMLQPLSSRAFVPGWYPAFCAGFDAAVATWLAVALRRRTGLAEA